MSIPSVPLAVGTANLGSRPVSQIGDPTTERNIKEFYRKNSGRWNRISVTIPASGSIGANILNSGNLRVSNVIFYAFPVALGGTIALALTESVSPGNPGGQIHYYLSDNQKQEYPGLDDRTYWTVENQGANSVVFNILYQEAGN